MWSRQMQPSSFHEPEQRPPMAAMIAVGKKRRIKVAAAIEIILTVLRMGV
jgi:hypothetical protein